MCLLLINNSHNDIAEEAIHRGNNATVFQAEVLQWEEQHPHNIRRNQNKKCCHKLRQAAIMALLTIPK